MATLNPFDLLGDEDAEDPSVLIAAAQHLKAEPKKAQTLPGKAAAGAKQPPTQNKVVPVAKLPSKPLPPSQAVREEKSEPGRDGRRGGRGYGRGRGAGGGFYRDSANNDNPYGDREISSVQGLPDEVDERRPSERRGGGYGGPRGSFRGGRRGGFSNGEGTEGERDRPRRTFDRHSGTGHGNDFKREGAGRGNWGTPSDDLAEGTDGAVNEGEKSLDAEKPLGEDAAAVDGDKEADTKEEEKEPEDKEMTLEEYEKLQAEKKKALQALKTEERKVDPKEFESMQPLSNKKANVDIFIKLGSEKDKKKELAEKEERAKKSVSINEFLKPAEGERYYSGGRGRGRGGRGSRGGFGGGNGASNAPAPAIEDPGQFPTLGGK